MDARGRAARDWDAIVVGAGHNGLVTAAYLARAGLRTLLLEARSDVGGTAASESFGGATVNICNCDHLTFRTTPVIDELGLADHGLRYLDVEPAQHNMSWAEPAKLWSHYPRRRGDHRLARRGDARPGRRLPAIREGGDTGDPHGARRGVRTAVGARAHPSRTPPQARRRTDAAAVESRRSAADVLRTYFDDDAVLGPAALNGPMVWGISPETPGTGLGALAPAMRHVGTVGRPVGGSGEVPRTLLASFEAAGGVLRTKSPVDTILCEGAGYAASVSSTAPSCSPRSSCRRATRTTRSCVGSGTRRRRRRDLLRRWRAIPHDEGYESKLDVVLDRAPALKGSDRSLGNTMAIAPEPRRHPSRCHR